MIKPRQAEHRVFWISTAVKPSAWATRIFKSRRKPTWRSGLWTDGKELNPHHAKKCPCCLEGHGFSWANIFYRFGLKSEVRRSKGNLCLAIPSVSCLIGRKEIVYVKPGFLSQLLSYIKEERKNCILVLSVHCCSLPHQGQARGQALQYCVGLVNIETRFLGSIDGCHHSLCLLHVPHHALLRKQGGLAVQRWCTMSQTNPDKLPNMGMPHRAQPTFQALLRCTPLDS